MAVAHERIDGVRLAQVAILTSFGVALASACGGTTPMQHAAAGSPGRAHATVVHQHILGNVGYSDAYGHYWNCYVTDEHYDPSSSIGNVALGTTSEMAGHVGIGFVAWQIACKVYTPSLDVPNHLYADLGMWTKIVVAGDESGLKIWPSVCDRAYVKQHAATQQSAHD
jgi:hypothetical protein